MAKKNEKMARTGRGVGGGPGKRYELTDDAWERIEPLLPTQRRGGRWAEHRTVLNGMFWVLNAGAQWRDMPERYGKWETVYGRYRRWTREGLFDRILATLHVSLDEYGRIDWSVFDVDGTNIRAHKSAAGGAGASKKTGRTSPPTSSWDDPAAALARSFIL
jgi:transposase